MIKQILYKPFFWKRNNDINRLNHSVQKNYQVKSVSISSGLSLTKNYKFSSNSQFRDKKSKINNKYQKFRPISHSQSAAHKIMQSIQSLVQNSEFKKRFSSYHCLQKYSFICLHTWIILNYLRNRIFQSTQLSEIFEAFKISLQLKSLFQQFTKHHTYDYNDYFDRSVYEQLQRVKQTMFLSLNEILYFGLQEKSVSQIVQQDLICLLAPIIHQMPDYLNNFLGKIDKQSISQDSLSNQRIYSIKYIHQYLLLKIQSLNSISFQLIRQGNIQLLLKKETPII